MMKAFHNAVLFSDAKVQQKPFAGGYFLAYIGVKSVFSAYIKLKLPPLNDFYHLTHLFSRSKSKENELKYTITTIPMKLFRG